MEVVIFLTAAEVAIGFNILGFQLNPISRRPCCDKEIDHKGGNKELRTPLNYEIYVVYRKTLNNCFLEFPVD